MKIFKWIGIAVVISMFLFILLLSQKNWNWARDLAAHQISELTHRTLTIDGDLAINWSLVPIIRVEKIKFENAAWGKHPYMFEIAALDITVDLKEILKGRFIIPQIILTKPNIILERSIEGKGNWEFQDNENANDKDIEYPVIERVRIVDGTLTYEDLISHTHFRAFFDTKINGEDGSEATVFQAEGKLKGRPLTINLNAGPLVALREAKKPYPMILELYAGETSIKVNGTLSQPLQLKGIDLQFDIKGPNPEQLSHILGAPMPNLPPYQLKGDLSHHDDIWQIQGLHGHVGDSDLAGNISLKMVAGQPHVTADLTSKLIDLDDLGPLLGLAPDTGPGETVSLAQRKEAEKQTASPFVFPHEPIDFKKLQDINVDILLSSKHVKSKLPVDDLRMHIISKKGHLVLAPLDFGVASGRIRSQLEFDTKSQPVKSKIEIEIHHVKLSEILRPFKIADKSSGLIGGQGIFWFKGNSVAEMLASVDGGLLMLMTGGRLDGLLVELAGLDLGEAIVALFDKDDNTEINCAFVDLPTSGGIINLRTFVVDTEDTVFLGSGSIDFNTEQMDLVIDPKPKDLSLFSARAPLHLKGSLKDPTFTPEASAIFRGAVSLALLPSAPIASLYSLLQKDQKNKGNHKQDNILCVGLVDAINEARK
ncbi:AsmA family protein [Nitrosomonas oligotropha]|uniref:AsmA family protein n=1 Tax=Nitrosomonas oligotropha TaxID=42354 RepID=UPI001370D74B|nr:AsmA family protein [Nitrosomonas oligotropha]MXS82732.1 AsmA family protein [Nitrosomonas oligotropha]